MPAATDWWIRPRSSREPGKTLDLKPTVAPDAKTAAHYYPANYWYALLKVPGKTNFPAPAPRETAFPPTSRAKREWLHLIKTDGCESCHQLGNKYTRTIPDMFNRHGASAGMVAPRAIRAGRRTDDGRLSRLGPKRATEMFGDWTTRIKNGELPTEAPPRPQGIERNIVITQWDWADPKAYLHDEISTDKRNPTVNANGLIYGSPEESRDYLPVLDPVHNTIDQVKIPYRDPDTPGQPQAAAALADLGRRSDLG